MLSSFDLKPGEDFGDFLKAYTAFVDEMLSAGIISGAGPLSKRVSDTPMDTDTVRDQQFHSTISFRDRAQLDSAYAHIREGRHPGIASHLSMYSRATNSVFLLGRATDRLTPLPLDIKVDSIVR